MDQEELHRYLLDPGCYPEPTKTVSFRETHISRVYLTDDFAYKFKKPLDLGFLDFSTLAKRQFFCHEEITLNRRFSPDTYLDVAVLRLGKRGPHFGPQGRIIDYAVHMRRLPEERMLSHLLDDNAPCLPVEIKRLAGHLAKLLAGTTPCLGEETAATVREKITGNLEQTRCAIGLSLSAEAHALMTTRMDQEVQRLAELIKQRSVSGYVRDGHGDLHAANICMTVPVRVYDCIEFCRRFRVADVAADLAFLLMDLDFRNRRDLAKMFLKSYQKQVDDVDLTDLLPLYKSYRAWVRGKVNTLLATELDVEADHRSQALSDARRYFNLSISYYTPPALLLVAGLMGVGKSTLARALEATTGASLFRSDVVRKELAGLPIDRPCEEPFASGLYGTAMNVRTYAELRKRTASALRNGGTVIVDASFSHEIERDAFIELAEERSIPVLLLHVTCDEQTTLERLDRRQRLGDDPSDGRREIYRQQAAKFAAFSKGLPVMKIDSLRGVDYNVQQVLCKLLSS